MKIVEANPSHVDKNQNLSDKFNRMIRNSENKTDTNKTEFFNLLYDNGFNQFEDDDEIRRIKLRQSICFTSIALQSDKERFDYFMDLAFYSISVQKGKPIEFLVEQYCGLIMTKIFIKRKYGIDFQDEIYELDLKLDLYKKTLETEFFNKTKLIIKQMEK